jgi:hypothetical protein
MPLALVNISPPEYRGWAIRPSTPGLQSSSWCLCNPHRLTTAFLIRTLFVDVVYQYELKSRGFVCVSILQAAL